MGYLTDLKKYIHQVSVQENQRITRGMILGDLNTQRHRIRQI